MIEFLDSTGVDLDARERPRTTRPRSTSQFANDTRQQSFVAATGNFNRQAVREILYFDIETCPDESRAHLFNLEPLPRLPTETPPDRLLDAEQFLSQDLKAIKEWLESHNPPRAWLESMVVSEKTSKKPRKSFYEAVDEHAARLTATANADAERNKLLSITPEYCRIVALGWAVGSGEVQSSVCNDVAGERQILQFFWSMLAKLGGPVAGYNVVGFDLSVICARSIILGVLSTKSFANIKPWDATAAIDLMVGRFPKSKAMKLKDLARLYGIDIPADDCDGSRVYEMVKAGQWKELGAYVRSDVEISRELHRKFSGYFTV